VRNSDRWVTPGVVVAAILTLGVVVLGIAAGLVFLASRGVDPDPVLRFVVECTGTLGVLANVGLSLAGRQTVAKTERNTGVLAGEVATVRQDVAYVAEVVEDSGRHHLPGPEVRPHFAPATVERRAAPHAPGN